MIETTEMGALFKKIRLSKKLALKDVAGDYLSISFLSKFERGESEISLSRFFLLLENLDVSIISDIGIPEIFLHEKLEYNMLLGAFWMKSGKVEIGKKLIENCLSVLKTLGANNLLVSHEAYYEELLDSTI